MFNCDVYFSGKKLICFYNVQLLLGKYWELLTIRIEEAKMVSIIFQFSLSLKQRDYERAETLKKVPIQFSTISYNVNKVKSQQRKKTQENQVNSQEKMSKIKTNLKKDQKVNLKLSILKVGVNSKFEIV